MTTHLEPTTRPEPADAGSEPARPPEPHYSRLSDDHRWWWDGEQWVAVPPPREEPPAGRRRAVAVIVAVALTGLLLLALGVVGIDHLGGPARDSRASVPVLHEPPVSPSSVARPVPSPVPTPVADPAPIHGPFTHAELAAVGRGLVAQGIARRQFGSVWRGRVDHREVVAIDLQVPRLTRRTIDATLQAMLVATTLTRPGFEGYLLVHFDEQGSGRRLADLAYDMRAKASQLRRVAR